MKTKRPIVNIDGDKKELPVDYKIELNALESFVHVYTITSPTSDGLKGQWSYGIVPWSVYSTNCFLMCVATNTWLEIANTADVASQLSLYSKLSDEMEMYVPITQLVNQDSVGIKGQFSVLGTRFFRCVATNTWMELTGATTFTV